jgi:hypothetical protein
MAYKIILNPFNGRLELAVSTSGGGSGTVTGIPPTNIGAIARWADTTGTTIENSPDTNVQDSGAIEAQGFISERNVNGTVTVNTDETWIAPGLTMQPGSNIIIAAGGQLLIL